MLKTVKLTNFRQHEELNIEFGDGLNVIRAPNEGGKSTVFEAIGYALYGTRALRDSMAETVTWGKKEKDLKVEVTIEANGKVYTFSRSKAGAEVTLEGKVFVTGQNEVSGFAAEIIGADVNAANVLMFANQNGLRGTIDQGPKATAQTIEALADLDLFDRILDRAADQLPMGSAALVETRLNGLRNQLEMIEVPEKPDTEALNGRLKEIGVELDGLYEVERKLIITLADAKEMCEAELNMRQKKDSLISKRSEVLAEIAGNTSKMEMEVSTLERVPQDIEEQIKGLEVSVARQDQHDRVLKAYMVYHEIPDSSCLSMTLQEVEEARDKAERAIEEIKGKINTLSTDIKVCDTQKIKANECSFCGQDISKFPEAATKNSYLTEQIRQYESQITELRGSMAEHQAELDKLLPALRAQKRLSTSIEGIHEYLNIVKSVTPWRVTWAGDKPENKSTDYRSQLKQAKEVLAERHRIEARVSTYRDVIASLTAKVKALDANIADIKVADDETFADMQRVWEEVEAEISEVRTRIQHYSKEVETLRSDYEARLESWKRMREKSEELASQIKQAEEEIKVLAFNNALIKKIRAARPIVANKLWSMVLSSVSTLFSRLRGVKSVVSKGTDGFMVNGRSVASLSGSTLDILGLAVRVSLTKTFLPGCQFLILDEPGAAMDDSREGLLLGFLASVGFSQVLLVTHSDISDSVADKLIEL